MAGAAGFENARDNGLPWVYPNDAPASLPITIAWGTHDWLLIPARGPARRAHRDRRALRLAEGARSHPMWDDPPQIARLLLEGSAA